VSTTNPINTKLILLGPLCKVRPNLSKNDHLIAIDGGIKFVEADSHLLFSIGDEDSGKKMDIKLPQNKDYSDLKAALDKVSDQYNTIEAWGLFGERLDHELINIAEFHTFLSKKINKTVQIFNAEGLEKVRLISKGTFEIIHQGLFSLFLFEKADIELKGSVEYPIEKKDSLKPLSSHGLSNLSFGSFQIDCSGPVTVFFP
jgi:thiamine pyrophosphokinase